MTKPDSTKSLTPMSVAGIVALFVMFAGLGIYFSNRSAHLPTQQSSLCVRGYAVARTAADTAGIDILAISGGRGSPTTWTCGNERAVLRHQAEAGQPDSQAAGVVR